MHKLQVITLLAAIAVTATAALYFKSKAKSDPGARLHSEPIVSPSADRCESQDDIVAEIKRLSRDTIEAREAVRRLLILARISPGCRAKTIDELVLTMNTPHLNFQADRPSFFLWTNGASVLGELKAVEALDMLINHSNLNDGLFSASMSHQPAIGAIITMGSAAVPKLSDALTHNQNREIRLAVALCLSEIGGQEATDALKEVLVTESDKCVRRFIELSFAYPTADVLKERLLAYRCGK